MQGDVVRPATPGNGSCHEKPYCHRGPWVSLHPVRTGRRIHLGSTTPTRGWSRDRGRS